MIKVVFTYKTKTEHLNELMEKFKESGSNLEFVSEVTNVKIDMFKKEEELYTYIILDIYYNSISDYEKRTKFEQSKDRWNEIWFDKDNKHEHVSTEILEVM